jgi:hypothetical protein
VLAYCFPRYSRLDSPHRTAEIYQSLSSSLRLFGHIILVHSCSAEQTKFFFLTFIFEEKEERFKLKAFLLLFENEALLARRNFLPTLSFPPFILSPVYSSATVARLLLSGQPLYFNIGSSAVARLYPCMPQVGVRMVRWGQNSVSKLHFNDCTLECLPNGPILTKSSLDFCTRCP